MGKEYNSWEMIFLLEVRRCVMLSIFLLAGTSISRQEPEVRKPFLVTPGNNKDLNISQVAKDSSASL